MDKFLMNLLGTNDYNLVLAGYIVAHLAAFYNSEKGTQFSIRAILSTTIGIFLFMRFYPFIMDFIGFKISIMDTMAMSLVAGFASHSILEAMKNKINEGISELD